MKSTLIILCVICLSFKSYSQENTVKAEEINSPAKRFFGIHFDLHAHEDMVNMGSGLNELLIDSFLTTVKPDFIQVDCKGHSGISSYPTKVGFQANSYDSDPLKLWRKQTAIHNIQLFVHFSGIYDKKVVREYPNWAITNSDGSKSNKICSAYSPYDSVYLIPQLKELAGRYNIDGAWIDGECWAIEPDYGIEAASEFHLKTGFKKLPVHPTDPGFYRFMNFQRQLFKRHVNNYLQALKQTHPEFKITSNWAFSSMMPEPVSLDLDFLSGDLTPGNAVYRAAFESRCMSNRGLPWDIMAWSFSWDQQGKLARNTKSSIQINQELAHILALGGGVQVYFKQQPDLSIIPWNIPIMEEIAIFAREREKYCFETEPVHEIGLLYSGFSYFNQINDIYPEWDPALESIRGCLNLLLDIQWPVEILYDFDVSKDLDLYKAIVIPNWDTLESKTVSQLENYVKNGGKLLIIGEDVVENFTSVFDFTVNPIQSSMRLYTGTPSHLFEVKRPLANIETKNENALEYNIYSLNDYRQPQSFKSLYNITIGGGEITIIPFDLGVDYLNYPHFAKRDFIGDAINILDVNPQVEVLGSRNLHVVLRQRKNIDQIHLINTSGPHADKNNLGFNELPSLRNITLKIPATNPPKKIVLQPNGTELHYTLKNNKLSVEIKEILIYNIIELIY